MRTIHRQLVAAARPLICWGVIADEPTERDHAELVKAIKGGRVKATVEDADAS